MKIDTSRKIWKQFNFTLSMTLCMPSIVGKHMDRQFTFYATRFTLLVTFVHIFAAYGSRCNSTPKMVQENKIRKVFRLTDVHVLKFLK